jgi:hypothetical protein
MQIALISINPIHARFHFLFTALMPCCVNALQNKNGEIAAKQVKKHNKNESLHAMPVP